MDPILSALMAEDAPKLNPLLADGLAVSESKRVMEYIRQRWKAVAADFPPGLRFIDVARCTPEDEFRELSKFNSKYVYETAPSNMFMVRFKFELNGEPFDWPCILPYVNADCTMYISGSRYVVSPVLSDRVISTGNNFVFIKLERTRLKIFRKSHFFDRDGEVEEAQIAHSFIYNPQKKERPSVTGNTTLPHYLFCKYGFSEAFQRVCGFIPVIGDSDMLNLSTMPAEDWILCSPRQQKIHGIKNTYTDKPIVIAVPRNRYNQLVRAMIGGFYYVVDRFPGRVKYDWVDDKDLWLRLMGHLLLSSENGEGAMLNKMQKHLVSLDEYVDEIMRRKFKDIGHPVENIYELFAILLRDINNMLSLESDDALSMYGKELQVLYYLLGPIREGINTFYFKLNNASPDQLNIRTITSLLKAHLSRRCIFNITNSNNQISTVNYPGDCKAFRMTTLLVPQANSTKGKNNSGSIASDPSKRFHVSVLECGSHLNVPKSDPSGRARLALFAKVDADNVLLPSPEFEEVRQQVQTLIKR